MLKKTLKLLSLTILAHCWGQVVAQPWQSPYNLHPPLAVELTLSGVFGEIRTNSFHAGIDFRTGGSALNVFASEAGFVSRIRVSGIGFGKAIYIEHPNGLTTVYAHLDRFSASIENFVKEHQYRLKSFEVDLYLKPNDFPVKRGQQIGISGNTGSSGGPHLHYEVRKTDTQTPLNPSFSNLKIIDSIPPAIQGAWFYPTDSTGTIAISNKKRELIVQGNGKRYRVRDTVFVEGTVGLGIKAYDYVNANSLRCGVYNIELFVNNAPWYSFKSDQFNFAETRFANSHIDFEERQLTGKRIHRLVLDPNNQFSCYGKVVNRGFIKTVKDSIYNIRIVVADAYGNASSLTYTMKGIENVNFNKEKTPIENSNEKYFWLFFQDNIIENEVFRVFIPKFSLYNNIDFEQQIAESQANSFSNTVTIHNRFTPIHKPYTIALRTNSLPQNLESKALIVALTHEGKIEAVGGNYSAGWVESTVNYFGTFFVQVDTMGPKIKPLNISKGKDMRREESIRFQIEDDLSGIQSIEGFINGSWVLFEVDPKNNLAYYLFDKKRLDSGKEHTLLLEANDKKGNKATYETRFFW